ncbi:SCO family protein [Alphaproteobacteria bacterium KMM 3653]|uniref:SCO family protein n=1 Tax=Harenicola maris TaxID=2841044 RepID=A0AAP2G8P5_9RHOB|nr:SCO family protein [Harenicola maris]
MTKLSAIAATGVAVLGLVALVSYTLLKGGTDQFADCRSLRIAGAGEMGGPFTLVNSEGQTVTDADVITEPSLIYFGYTFCPDVCPFDTARNADTTDILAERGHSITPIFITVDPARDDAESMGNFAANLHDKMIGLTGSEEQVAAAAQAYRAFYQKQDTDDEDYYLVNHTAYSYLVTPEHGFLGAFDRALDEEQLADQIACYLDAA